MNLLVLSEDYPNKDNLYAMPYVHNRVVEYLKEGVNVTVVSFKTDTDYFYEGVRVIRKGTEINFNSIDLIVSHAPNIKNHICYLARYNKGNKVKVIFFFHGHEIMDTKKYYPEAYSYDKSSVFKKNIQKIYDPIKLVILKKIIFSLILCKKLSLVFVSDWMKEMAFDSLGLTSQERIDLNYFSYTINNGINDIFLHRSYSPSDNYHADFITIRPFDNPKYCIDLIYDLAKHNENYTFHVYGRGIFFKYVDELPNLKVFEHFITPNEIPNYLDKYKCALMPTKLDAQGVMMCEMATYGIPLITSDINICREMLDNFNNVNYISNNLARIKIGNFIPKKGDRKNYKFDNVRLVQHELELFYYLKSQK